MAILPSPWFLFGDLLASSVTGALVGVLCLAVIPADWNMFIAMFPGMLLGMLVPLFLAPLVFARYFGAMEIMVPAMLGGMLSGMWMSMAVTMKPFTWMTAAWQGVSVALLALAFCYLLDLWIRLRSGARG